MNRGPEYSSPYPVVKDSLLHLKAVSYLATSNPTYQDICLLELIDKFALVVTDRFVNGIDKLALRDIEAKGESLQPIFQYARAKGLTMPTFSAMDHRMGNQFTEQHALPPLAEGELLLTFQLPKVLAAFWHKGIGSWGEKGVDTQNMVIEWGRYYRELLPKVWHKIQKAENHKEFQVRRLNPKKEHESKDYYYAWGVKAFPRVSIGGILRTNKDSFQPREYVPEEL